MQRSLCRIPAGCDGLFHPEGGTGCLAKQPSQRRGTCSTPRNDLLVAQPVDIVNHRRILRQHPRGPRIHVPDLHPLQRRPAQRTPHLPNISHDRLGIRPDPRLVRYALWRAAVQILAPHRNPHDALLHLVRPEVRGLLERDDLVVDGRLARGGPDAEEQVGLRVERGFDGFDGRVGAAALDRGVEAGGGEAGGVDEAFGAVELVEEVLVVAAAAVGLIGAW